MKYQALALDYDGTLAYHGRVDAPTIAALERLKATGRKLLMVTGREMPDLQNAFEHTSIFDLIVAENGALLYDPEAAVRDAAFSALEKLFAAEPLRAADAGLGAAFEDVRRRGLQALVAGSSLVRRVLFFTTDREGGGRAEGRHLDASPDWSNQWVVRAGRAALNGLRR